MLDRLPYPWQRPQWHGLMARSADGRLPHALLLSGPSGMGKRYFAECLAWALLCEQPVQDGAACGNCRSCLLMAAGNHPDFIWVTPEEGKQGIGIDQIRDLIAFQELTCQYSKHRVIVLHPADAINRSAANALLKTLEEPVGTTALLLISDHPAVLLPTVRSRCQQILFRPLAREDNDTRTWLLNHFPQGMTDAEVDALMQGSGGIPLLAVQMLEQDEWAMRGQVLSDLMAIHDGKASAAGLAKVWEKQSLQRLLHILYSLLADMIRLKMLGNGGGLANPLLLKDLQALTEQVDLAFLDTLLQRVQERSGLLQRQLKPQVILEEVLLAWQQRRI